MKKALITILKYVVFLGLGIWIMYHMLHQLKPDESKKLVAAITQSLHPPWFLISICIVGTLSHYVRAVRWRYLLETIDPDLINAGKQTITTLPGSAFFDSAMSFGMIRAGKVHLTVLGAMEVADNGDIANWKIPKKMVKGMGGAMDLVAAAKNIIVAMQHTNPKGESKLLPQCSLPLTGVGCVRKIVSDLGVFDITPDGFRCIEYAPGVTIDEIKAKTAGMLVIADDVKEMTV